MHNANSCKYSVIHDSLILASSPLHIKVGLAKKLVKALDSLSPAFQYKCSMFPKLLDAKLIAGVFTGPQICCLLQPEDLETTMSILEKDTWQAIGHVVNGFLGNNRSEDYKEIVESLVTTYHAFGCRMSIKLYFLLSHLDFFRPKEAVSEEHDKRFHQDIQVMEKRY